MGADCYQTGSNCHAIALRHKEQPVLRHGVLHALEEVAAQIGRIAMLVISAFITLVEKIPVGVADVWAQRPAEADARVKNLAALLTDFLALFLAQGHQEVVEATEMQA